MRPKYLQPRLSRERRSVFGYVYGTVLTYASKCVVSDSELIGFRNQLLVYVLQLTFVSGSIVPVEVHGLRLSEFGDICQTVVQQRKKLCICYVKPELYGSYGMAYRQIKFCGYVDCLVRVRSKDVRGYMFTSEHSASQ